MVQYSSGHLARSHKLERIKFDDLTGWEQRQIELRRQREVKRRIKNRLGKHFLDTGEWCYLQRRRAGMTMAEVCGQLGISHVALIRRERGDGKVNQLVEYWQKSLVT